MNNNNNQQATSALSLQHSNATAPKRGTWGWLTSFITDPSNSRQLNQWNLDRSRRDQILENEKKRAFTEKWNERYLDFSKNAIQYRKKDLEAAGINPMLAAWGQGSQLPTSQAPNTSSNFQKSEAQREDLTGLLGSLLKGIGSALSLKSAIAKQAFKRRR